MRTSALILAVLPVVLGACHSGGAYFEENPMKPRGPGVVDCGWYYRDDPANTYVVEYEAPSRAAEISYYGWTRTTGATYVPVVAAAAPAAPVTVSVPQPPVRTEWKGSAGSASVSAPATTRLPPPPAPRAVTATTAPAYVRTAPPAPRAQVSSGEMVQGKVVRVPKAATIDIDAEEVTLPPPRPGAPLNR